MGRLHGSAGLRWAQRKPTHVCVVVGEASMLKVVGISSILRLNLEQLGQVLSYIHLIFLKAGQPMFHGEYTGAREKNRSM
jgi:hypothetical protein